MAGKFKEKIKTIKKEKKQLKLLRIWLVYSFTIIQCFNRAVVSSDAGWLLDQYTHFNPVQSTARL